MPRLIAGISVFTALCCAASAQVDKALTFDAATVKPAELPSGVRMMFAGAAGGPGSKDPGRIRYQIITLKNLLAIAYGLKDYQVYGPAWIDSEHYEVMATMPVETTREQFLVMLRNLLAERFQLTAHKETREMPAYTLTVAKSGARIKASGPIAPPAEGSVPPPPPPPFAGGALKMGPDGFPIMPVTPGRQGNSKFIAPGRAKLIGTQQTMEQFASVLTSELKRPVTDATGLAGRYDYELTYAPEDGQIPPAPQAASGTAALAESEPLPALQAALQQQLGLRIDPKKVSIEVVVMDKGEKVPTAN